MPRYWRPKYKVLCAKCGWKGTRAAVSKKCPQCDFWYPKKVNKVGN